MDHGHKSSPLLSGCISSMHGSDATGGAAAREDAAASAVPGLGSPMLPRPLGTVAAVPAAASEAGGFCWVLAAAPAAVCAALRPAPLPPRPPAKFPARLHLSMAHRQHSGKAPSGRNLFGELANR